MRAGPKSIAGLIVAAAAVGAAALGPGACNSAPGEPSDMGDVTLEPAAAAALLTEMEPTEARVHPLTRLEPGPGAGGERLSVHFELLDQFGQGTKWLGRVEIVLSPRRSGLAAIVGGGEQRYVRDLTQPRANADAFDWVTRCYVVPCGDLSDELLAAARRGDLRIDVTFSALLLDGSRRRLGTTFEMPAVRE